MTLAIGVLGVGAIASAIVDGLCDAPGAGPEVLLSPRNATVARSLARKHDSVRLCEDNQCVVDGAPVVILTVRPDQVHGALDGLRLPPGRIVVSAVAGLRHEALRAYVGDDVPIVRAIPLPAVRKRQGVTAIYPAHQDVAALFRRLGGVIEVSDGAAFDALSTTTATISAFLHYLELIAAWSAPHGVDAADAERYVRSVFVGLVGGLADQTRSLAELVGDHETPDGLNERFRTTWLNESAIDHLALALDGINGRVAGGRSGAG